MSSLEKFASNYIDFNPKAASKVLEKFGLDEICNFLFKVEEKSLQKLLTAMDPPLVSSALLKLPDQKVSELLDIFSVNFATKVLQTVQNEDRLKLVNLASESKRTQIERLLQHLPETAGFYMDSGVTPFNIKDQVDDCLQRIRKNANTSYYIYIVNDDNVLVGITSMRKLLLEQQKNLTCEQILEAPVFSLKVAQGAKEVITDKKWENFSALPVVDFQDKFLGVINHKIFEKMKRAALGKQESQDIRAAGETLGELYSIGFTALVGSTSMLHEKDDDDE